MNVENNDESIPNLIEYKNYPIMTLAFYSGKHNKIYISPLAKKHPRLHKYLIEHETKHYYCNKKSIYLAYLCHYLVDWIDVIKLLDLRLTCEVIKSGKEFRKINFSKEEIDNFNVEFSTEKYSKDWYLSILSNNLGSTGIITWGLIIYLFSSHFYKNVLDPNVVTLFIMCFVFYLHYRFEIKKHIQKYLSKRK